MISLCMFVLSIIARCSREKRSNLVKLLNISCTQSPQTWKLKEGKGLSIKRLHFAKKCASHLEIRAHHFEVACNIYSRIVTRAIQYFLPALSVPEV